MNVDFVSCAAAATAAQALALIAAARAVQPEALIKLHVVEEDKRLAGVVSVIALLQAEPSESVRTLMDSDPVRVSAVADLTDIALLMADFNLYSIPVVDEQDRVLGVVTVDDVLEATIPEDWRRREPAPRPVREITQPGDDRNTPAPGGTAT
jgi:Mg/Co/Ni transporter MgtE